jgi:hypothetical protein
MKRAILIAALAVVAIAATPGMTAAQTASPRCSPAPVDCSGWYAVNVNLSWTYNALITEDCDNFPFTRDGIYQRTCRVRNSEQEPWIAVPVTVRLDKVAPVVAGVAPSRGADNNGWYRSPVDIKFFGDDATSGVAGCSSGTYSGRSAGPRPLLGPRWQRQRARHLRSSL